MKKRLQDAIVVLGKWMKARNLTLVTAESCTGGGLSYFISISPEISSILERGYVTYSNQSKQELLKVSPQTIQLYGAVSKQVAIEMAKGALEKSNAQIAIALTGIAGPDKKLKKSRETGVVWIACMRFDKKPLVKLLKIGGKRSEFCNNTILQAANILKTYLTSNR